MNRRAVLTSGLRFAATGVANTAIGLAIITLARKWAGASEYWANAAGYAVGLTVGFVLNRSWSFQTTRSLASTAPRYLLAFALSYAANVTLLYVGLEHTTLHPNLIQAAALVTYSTVFFLLCRRLVFRQ